MSSTYIVNPRSSDSEEDIMKTNSFLYQQMQNKFIEYTDDFSKRWQEFTCVSTA